MTHTLPLPDFAHERVEVTTGRRSGLFIAVALHSSVLGSARRSLGVEFDALDRLLVSTGAAGDAAASGKLITQLLGQTS